MIGLYVDPLRSPTSCALFMRLAQDRALADGIPLDSAVRIAVQVHQHARALPRIEARWAELNPAADPRHPDHERRQGRAEERARPLVAYEPVHPSA
ncbi:hypothetical protein [Agromyces badenianii]|uniref:hypothetical protein n=1 Tax=Agromyces badenianii TaxID=2080742 RepID=UPI00105AA23C|nr:hypothetical protein [Agromyces badenianii]